MQTMIATWWLVINMNVTATVYQAVPEQCNNDPYVTAFGYHIDPKDPLSHRYLAISRDLEEYLSAGDSVEVFGTDVYDGKWVVADRMNRRWSRKIDLLVNMDSHIDIFRDVIIIKCSEKN